jgi:hypothetical protein
VIGRIAAARNLGLSTVTVERIAAFLNLAAAFDNNNLNPN